MDCTVGEGGHAIHILEESAPDGRLIGLDVDREVLALAERRLLDYSGRYTLLHDNFKNLPGILSSLKIHQVSGILGDLGLSSFQLDSSTRGFSFAVEAPLDMRMDPRLTVTAADLINTLSQNEIEKLLWNFADERWAKSIARAVLTYRQKRPITTTTELKEIVLDAVPTGKRQKIHPATRTFQALRIAVNRELENLDRFITDAVDALEAGGRLVIISFHSLEDRVVKKTFQHLAQACICPPDFPVCKCVKKKTVDILTRKPVVPGEEEIRLNFRSRSAKLRALKKL